MRSQAGTENPFRNTDDSGLITRYHVLQSAIEHEYLHGGEDEDRISTINRNLEAVRAELLKRGLKGY